MDMPNGVTNFPRVCDPRISAPAPDKGVCFCYEGYERGFPAPWRFRVNITNATAPMDVFNGVHFIDFISREPIFDRCTWGTTLPGGQVITLAKTGLLVPDMFGNTVIWDLGLDCSACSPPMFPGVTVGVPFPRNSDTLPPFVFTPTFPQLPDPVIITPRAFDATA